MHRLRAPLIFFFFFLTVGASAQRISVIKLTELEKRISNSSDTTYIVNFWATWCVPCVKELPDFDSISRQYAGEKVKMLLVSLDFKEDLEGKVLPFLQKRKLHPEVFLLDESNGNYFIPRISEQWTGAIPATLILNNHTLYRQFYEKKISHGILTEELKKAAIKQ